MSCSYGVADRSCLLVFYQVGVESRANAGNEGQSAVSAGEAGGGQWELGEEDLPIKGWPVPTSDMWSPFSSGSRCV